MAVSRRMDEMLGQDEVPAHFSDLRRSRGISLEAISERTKIPIRVLEALEAERFERFPRGIFARSYVRSYAIEAGLDPDAVLARVIRKLPGDEPIEWLDMGLGGREFDDRLDAENANHVADGRRTFAAMASRIPWRTAAALVVPMIVLLISTVVATATIRGLVWPSPPVRQAQFALAPADRDAAPHDPARRNLDAMRQEALATPASSPLSRAAPPRARTFDIELEPPLESIAGAARKAPRRAVRVTARQKQKSPIGKAFSKIGRGFKKLFTANETRDQRVPRGRAAAP